MADRPFVLVGLRDRREHVVRRRSTLGASLVLEVEEHRRRGGVLEGVGDDQGHVLPDVLHGEI